ncbi:Helix-turn-helix domain-containing protein [Amycolatopsis marina]|uniref:Helix-turn-helix domain-containing protein n=1 Tax=Amycolatopsis marina TaxID=490629 RepID=A0A1I1CC78_9PSEU|nr:helix-turn-helix domain-containing protein [Amycolatopsis marina]SFB58003.1 Helix-turn-helix domain-containing protein [Amycolatopsis marina]
MNGLPERRRVRDAELMRALAHPLRAALLDHLMAVGPRTASECAEAVASSASNCSWHLRKLAEFGLVEPSAAEDGRQRPWRACQVGLELGEPGPDPALRSARLAAVGTMLGTEQVLTQRYLDAVEDLDPKWRDSGGLNSYALTVTPEELTELVASVDALIRPYVGTIRTETPDGARPVHVGLRAFLRIEADGEGAS